MAKINLANLQSLSFPEAIAFTQTWLDQVLDQPLSDAEILEQMGAILSHRNGVRGFFVTYLTGDSPLADHPPEIFLEGFAQNAEHINEILVKNVAMSAAMTVIHRQSGDYKQQQSSEKVAARSINILKQLEQRNLEIFKDERLHLIKTLQTRTGKYQEFLERWQYNPEQREVMRLFLQSI